MHRFTYRAPRFSVDLPVKLTLQDSTHLGRCKEISTEGMRLELREPVPPDSYGAVCMSYQDLSLEVQVRVANCGPNHDGVRFLYESDEQRSKMENLVARLSAAQDRQRPILLK